MQMGEKRLTTGELHQLIFHLLLFGNRPHHELVSGLEKCKSQSGNRTKQEKRGDTTAPVKEKMI